MIPLKYLLPLLLIPACGYSQVAPLPIQPRLTLHSRIIQIDEELFWPPIKNYALGQNLTFEVYMDGSDKYDYVIDSCSLNGVQFISSPGCFKCEGPIMQAVESHGYAVPGGIKRTLVYFIATERVLQFDCTITVLSCCACAEMSCDRGPSWIYTQNAYQTGASQSYALAAYARQVGYGIFGGWWWPLWLIIPLLLLCLLCCLLPLLLWLLGRWRQSKRKTVTTTHSHHESRDVAVSADLGQLPEKHKDETIHANLAQAIDLSSHSYGHHEIHETTEPAVVIDETYRHEIRETFNEDHVLGRERERDLGCRHYYDDDYIRERGKVGNQFGGVYGCEGSRRRSRSAGAVSQPCYVVHEERKREAWDRVCPNGQREVIVGNASAHHPSRSNDNFRGSYRNYTFERDMGRVEPLEGYDQVESCHKEYFMDDEDEMIERDVKRTHTTRFKSETREFDEGSGESGSDGEKFREEEHHHHVYAPRTHFV